jgi:hypothetical protein
LAIALISAFAIQFVLTLASVVTSWLELETMDNPYYDYESEGYEMIENLNLMITGASGMIGILLVVLWCVWTNMSCKNAWLINSYDGATAIYRGRDSYTPGWAVGWFFIPVALLWKPFQAMVWIRDASQKPLGLTMGKLLGLWWTFWILLTVTDRVITRMFTKASTIEELSAAHRTFLAVTPIDLLATIFAACVVQRLTKVQKVRVSELGLMPN